MKKEVSVIFLLLAVLFNVCLVASNLLGTKLINVFGISVTGGLMIFPISYIINDCVAEVWGYRKARLLIWTGFASNFFTVAVGLIAVAIPAAPFWEGEEHFNFVFGMAPRIAFASIMAYMVGSFLNAWVMSRMKMRVRWLESPDATVRSVLLISLSLKNRQKILSQRQGVKDATSAKKSNAPQGAARKAARFCYPR